MTDQGIIAYLLKELPEEALERFEEECFAQEEWPDQIGVVEDELIEAYLRDELEPEQRQHFEGNYLTTPARQARVALAAAVRRYADEGHAASQAIGIAPPPKAIWTERFDAFWRSLSWPLRIATAAALIAVIAGALWFFIPRSPSGHATAALALTISNNNRAEGIQAEKVKLTSDIAALRITLALPPQTPPAARYRVELENENGATKSLEVAENQAKSILVIIPAAQLARGQYALKLFVTRLDGAEQRMNGSYYFEVE
ncbi:MAG TPA: hypothetical protein VJ464_08945 [Blastocatellia bacterium]|nr:hypothetical protein [Blastocatellia bacterium]